MIAELERKYKEAPAQCEELKQELLVKSVNDALEADDVEPVEERQNSELEIKNCKIDNESLKQKIDTLTKDKKKVISDNEDLRK
jgi:hypothetical protein